MRQIPPLRKQPVGEYFLPEGRFEGATQPERFRGVPDPDDRKFAALAYAAGVPLISNDSDLLDYRSKDVEVLTPGAAVEVL